MKDIKGWEGLYAITSCGKVWSYRRKKFLKPYTNEEGYQTVGLYDNNKRKLVYIHRLVAEAFIPNPNNYDTIDHIDYNKNNNNVNNLKWMSRKENSRKRRINRAIFCVENETIYPSQLAAAEALGLSQGNVSKVCRGLMKQTKGYHFIRLAECESNEST